MTDPGEEALAALDRIERILSTPAEEKQPTHPTQPHELLAEQLHAAQSKWMTLGAITGGPDGEAA